MLNILVTGASGLIGGALCAALVDRGHSVAALTHSQKTIRGNDGKPVRIHRILRGDIRADGLGLGPAQHAALGDIDLIVHCAASTRFDLDRERHRAINVAGTARVIDFAQEKDARLLHMSTAYVCGLRDGLIEEEPVPPHTQFANGYEASKAEAETLVREGGTPFAILRPSIVLGDNASGAMRDFGAIYAAFRLLAEGRVAQMPRLPGTTLNFVGIDHVVRSAVSIVEQAEKAEGRTFHLTASRPLPIDEFIETIAGYPQFGNPEPVDARTFSPGNLPPRERRLFTRILGPYASYFSRDPRFCDEAARDMTGIVPPPCDTAFLCRQIDYAIERGFLPAAPAQRMSG